MLRFLFLLVRLGIGLWVILLTGLAVAITLSAIAQGAYLPALFWGLMALFILTIGGLIFRWIPH